MVAIQKDGHFFVAWFKAANSLTLDRAATNSGTLTVEKTSASVTMAAKVNFVVEDPGLKQVELTTWVSSALKKGTVPENLSPSASAGDIAANVRLVDATVADETYKLAVKAYVTDDSTEEEKAEAGHDAAWLAGMETYQNDTTTKNHVTYSYANTDGTGSVLLTNEVFFYCASDETYTEGHEGISGASGKTQQLDVDMKSLYVDGNDLDSDPDHWATSADPVTIGYLYVRFEGSLRVHTQNSYTAVIAAAAASGAAAANS